MLFLNLCLCGCVHVSPGGKEERLRPPWSGHDRQLCAELGPLQAQKCLLAGPIPAPGVNTQLSTQICQDAGINCDFKTSKT